jgi:hypothetical protein
MYEQVREFLLAIASAAAFLAGFNALIFFQLVERGVLTPAHLQDRRTRVWLVLLVAGTASVLASLFLAVNLIPAYQESLLTVPASVEGQRSLTQGAFTFGYIASFLGLAALGAEALHRASKPKPS